MKQLDRSQFVVRMSKVAIRVHGINVKTLRDAKETRSHVLNMAKIAAVQSDPDSDSKATRLILLKYDKESDVPEDVASFLTPYSLGYVQVPITLEYDYWNAGDILDAILPEELVGDSPASFTHTGHIAHMNLQDEYLPYKHVIGQIMLDVSVQ